MLDIYNQLPVIEYRKHPAFQNIDPGKTLNYDYDEVQEILTELVKKRKSLENVQPINFFLSKINIYREKTKEAYREFISYAHAQLNTIKSIICRNSLDWTDFDINTIEKFIEIIKQEIYDDTCVLWWQNQIPQHKVVKDKVAYKQLEDNGYTEFQFDEKVIDKLRGFIASLETKIRESETSNPMFCPMQAVDPKIYPEFSNLLKNCLVDMDVFSIASNYLKREVFLDYVLLNVSRPEDAWWRIKYHDCELDLPNTANMHYDSASGMIKLIIYLNDVIQEEAGPFCYIPNTKNAYNQADYLRKMSGKAAPYAGINLIDYESRRLMLKLPELFHNQSHFGDDILKGTFLEDMYQSAEKKFTGNRGLCILFDNYGLHRGGLSESGERVALQIGLRARERTPL